MRTRLIFCTLTSNVNCCSTRYNLFSEKPSQYRGQGSSLGSFFSSLQCCTPQDVYMYLHKHLQAEENTSCKHFSFLTKFIYIRQVFWLENTKKSLWIGFMWVGWCVCKKYLCQVLIWTQALLPACRMHCWKLNVLWTKAKEP